MEAIEKIQRYKQNMKWFSRKESIDSETQPSKIDGVLIQTSNAIKDIKKIPWLGQKIDFYA